jgi:hypothetical protein
MKESDDAEDLVVVETERPADEAVALDEDKKPDDKARPDPRTQRAAEDDDEDVDPDDPDDKERESIRERRRLEKAERKQRRDEAIKRDKLELDFLRKRNDDLERRLTAQEQRSHQADLRGIDAEIARAQQEAEMAEKVIAKAVAAGNGEDVAQALKYRDAAQQKAQQLAWQKQQAAAQAAAQQKAAQTGIDDAVMRHAQEFLKENPWYDTQGRDEDSAIVLAIDQSLAKDGFNPQTPDYWDELRRRAARRLPERFASGPAREEPAPRAARGGPAVGSGKEHAPATTRREVYISPERKQALIDAGVWDDPVLRMKYVRRYAEYDRAQRSQA